jgi:hypothetical protein
MNPTRPTSTKRTPTPSDKPPRPSKTPDRGSPRFPAEVVVTNHVMGLYELAAIHLSSDPVDLVSAALAIDAVGCLVEGLGPRLGDEHQTMTDALANIRMAFVQVKAASGAAD